MKNRMHFLAIGLFLALLTGCKRYDDTYFKVRVVDEADNSPISNVEVMVSKLKNKLLVMGNKKIDGYSCRTNQNGECAILIQNYDRKNYFYSVYVNYHHDRIPPDFGGYTYSTWGTKLEPDELKNKLEVKLTKLLLPDYTGEY